MRQIHLCRRPLLILSLRDTFSSEEPASMDSMAGAIRRSCHPQSRMNHTHPLPGNHLLMPEARIWCAELAHHHPSTNTVVLLLHLNDEYFIPPFVPLFKPFHYHAIYAHELISTQAMGSKTMIEICKSKSLEKTWCVLIDKVECVSVCVWVNLFVC